MAYLASARESRKLLISGHQRKYVNAMANMQLKCIMRKYFNAINLCIENNESYLRSESPNEMSMA
jgi:hypothetical protein